MIAIKKLATDYIRDIALITLLAIMGLILAAGFSHADNAADMAKQSQNPVSSIISLPFENNTNFGVGPENAATNVLNIKPIYPVSLGEWNLVHRGILPIIYQGERFLGEGSEFGLGDFNYQGFFTPAKPGKIIWGVGPSLVFPTHTDDRLGSGKWSAGPAALVLTMPGSWVLGVLAQNVWSYAGPSNEPDVNQFVFQYFINYNLSNGWYLTSTPTLTADWEANNSNRWTIPFGGGAGRLFKIGDQITDVKAQAFWYAEKPEYAADWTLQIMFKLLFPK